MENKKRNSDVPLYFQWTVGNVLDVSKKHTAQEIRELTCGVALCSLRDQVLIICGTFCNIHVH
ncbi:hypothetical protein E2C01_025740 [Portunus trituberculatus]|uniref:Uncharacterized protein n=1 Tax=Portunus trituberculatus TaxID=210409 RepID=A0A5B7EDR0_PORTR|nr:hypothetical protein [Portunus trituberculatus]